LRSRLHAVPMDSIDFRHRSSSRLRVARRLSTQRRFVVGVQHHLFARTPHDHRISIRAHAATVSGLSNVMPSAGSGLEAPWMKRRKPNVPSAPAAVVRMQTRRRTHAAASNRTLALACTLADTPRCKSNGLFHPCLEIELAPRSPRMDHRRDSDKRQRQLPRSHCENALCEAPPVSSARGVPQTPLAIVRCSRVRSNHQRAFARHTGPRSASMVRPPLASVTTPPRHRGVSGFREGSSEDLE